MDAQTHCEEAMHVDDSAHASVMQSGTSMQTIVQSKVDIVTWAL